MAEALVEIKKQLADLTRHAHLSPTDHRQASTMTAKTTLLVTGGNRGRSLSSYAYPETPVPLANLLYVGLGKGLIQHYLAQPNYTCIVGVRDPNHATSKGLFNLPRGDGSSIIVVKIESTSETDAASAVKELDSSYGITALDIVVANAGISKIFPPVSEAKIPDILEHFNINVIGVIHLFQAVFPLLNKAKAPKFITLGTSAASLSNMENRNFPNTPYGTSKVALNYVTRKIHFENPNLIAFPLDPG